MSVSPPVFSPLPEHTRHHEQLISTLPCAVYDYVLWPDGRSCFTYISPQCADMFELSAESIMADSRRLWALVHEDDLNRLQSEDFAARRSGRGFQSEIRIVLPSGRTKWMQLTSRPGTRFLEGQEIWSGVILDITDRKLVEAERDQLLEELRDALNQVKTLSGFLPICASCKKIRDDGGYWTQLEAYISEHSEAEFSHGICPDCADRFMAEFRETIATETRSRRGQDVESQ
ncbi:PAS domain-containing protein [Actomonas aquatica]|uniref:PAS domain-containing protein n=1 Tax=Actomonas aquatica TaxID=2866162 RepID=A0ABZ1C7F4_9BACT|nr:PAS domain-containing protein [Opitutus sp. WL0086]WRQ87332.1 PAS domain-containing protein [Opitutus sp. WL0086]